MKITKTLTIIGTAAILLTSCSQQRYAHRSKVRVDENHQTAVRKHKQESIKEVRPSLPEMQVEQPKHDAVQALPIAPSGLQNVVSSNKEETRQKPNVTLNSKQKELIKQPVKKLEKIKKKSVQDDPLDSKWFKLMLVGLLLALIGTLLSFILLGAIGGVIAWVGSVVFVIGLILWIVELVV